MISSLISKYMVNKVVNQSTPKINNKKCINSLQKRQKCEKCKEVCIKEAISLENKVKLDKDICDNCNICSTTCPSGAIVSSIDIVEKQYNSIVKVPKKVSIGCNNKTENSTVNIQCLASLPWEFFAYIALDKEIDLLTLQCADCNNKELAKQVEVILEKLKIFLGEELYNEKITNVDSIKKDDELKYSRRELFKLFGEESKKVLSDMAPVKIEENKNSRIYRSLLMKKINEDIEKHNKSNKYNFATLNLNDKCWGCGVCEKICPQKAIEIKEDENKERKLTHNYIKCTGCEVCKSVCLYDAINFKTEKINIQESNNEFNISSRKCKVCDDYLNPIEDEICIICKRKNASSN